MSTVVASALTGSGPLNQISYTNPFDPLGGGTAFSSPADAFGIYQREVSPSIPLALLDDSLSIFTSDELGIIGEGNLAPFFGAVDTDNNDNSDVVAAEWVFDIAGATDLALSIDFGAMGDFESADAFTLSYAIDGVAMGDLFTFSADEAASQTYTLDGGGVVTLNDPLLLDGTVLTNTLATFSSGLAGTGDELAVIFTADTNGGREVLAFQNLVVTAGDTGTAPILLNEVFASHTGTDDTEFVELVGTPGASLAGLSFIGVESDDQPSRGAIDARIDFGADAVIGDNGFFLIGNPVGLGANYGVTPNLEIGTNFLENSSVTYALVETASLTGDSVTGSETVLDSVALTDGDVGDTFFLDAPVVGPDGNFLPAGARRAVDGVDTDSADDWVISDFFLGDANTPTAGTGITEPPVPPSTVVFIHEVQGAGDTSPLDGETVTVEAIVVGDFQDGIGSNGDLNGFFLQEEDTDADADPATSEGIFVFDGFGPAIDVTVGDRVRVTGEATEFFGETQISATEVTVISEGNALPTAAEITFPVASTRTNSDGQLIADLEAYEGMLVTVPDTLTVSDLFTLGRFGDIGLQAGGRLEQFTQASAPDVAGFQAYQDLAVRNAITLDDGSTVQNPETIPFEIPSEGGSIPGQFDAGDDLTVGDTVTDLTGVLRFGRGSGGSGDEIYRVNPTDVVPFENTNPREATPPETGGDLTVAAFNVLNFFTTLDQPGNPGSGPDGLGPRGAEDQTELDRQLDKLLVAFEGMDADIYGLTEIENEFGDQNGDDLYAIGYLVDALNERDPTANYAYVDPGSGFVGTDAIAVGLIYDTNAVDLAPGTTPAILTDSMLGDLGLDFGNPVFDGSGTSRAPIAATFEEIATGEVFTVTVNHFKSKGSISPFGDNAGIGDGAGNNNEARTQAAIALDAWLDSDPTGSGDEDVLILGDLNAYSMEDPVQYLLDEGYVDTVEAFLGPDEVAYSFGFPISLATSPQVQAFGALDYALASQSMASQVTGSVEWHINADEASALDYNTNFKPSEQITDLYAPSPFRSSDHDPVIVGLQLGPNLVAEIRDRSKGTDGADRFDNFGGSQDRMFSQLDEVRDVFVFDGSVTGNGERDRGFIFDFEINHDVLQLTGGAEVAGVFEDRGDLLVRFAGDGDLLRIEGPDLTEDGLNIETIVAPDMIA